VDCLSCGAKKIQCKASFEKLAMLVEIGVE